MLGVVDARCDCGFSFMNEAFMLRAEILLQAYVGMSSCTDFKKQTEADYLLCSEHGTQGG